MKKIYIGNAGCGKSTKLQEDLREAIKNNIINDDDSTLLFVLESEQDAYRSILPNATYCINEELPQKREFTTLVVDTIYMTKEKLSSIGITDDGELPSNVFWTFQEAKEMAMFFPVLSADDEASLSLMDEEISREPKCVVLEVDE